MGVFFLSKEYFKPTLFKRISTNHGFKAMEIFKIEHKIANQSNKHPLIVKVKGGLSYIIRATNTPTYNNEQSVTVTLVDVYLESLNIDPNSALTKLDRHILEKLSAERNKLLGNDQYYHRDLPSTITVKVHLEAEHADENLAIHSELLGMTMYRGIGHVTSPSLKTPTATLREALDQYEEQGKNNRLYYCVYVNDPKRTQNQMYVNVMGKSTEVPIVYDEDQKAGLYIGLSLGNKPRETLFYSFHELTTEKLEGMGIFRSKAECDKGGNTARYIEAENKIKQLQKDLGDKTSRLEDTTGKLEKAEGTIEDLSASLNQLKLDHKAQLEKMRTEYWVKATHTEQQSKMTDNMFKFENRIKDITQKANMDNLKQKSNVSLWGDLLKAGGALLGIGITGYRLLTS